MTDDIVVRPRQREDDPRILEIYHQHETEFPLTLESLRFHLDERARPEGTDPRAAVAERDGMIVGDWYLQPNEWSADPNAYFASVEVDTCEYGKGVGSKLWEDLEREAIALGARKVYAHIRESEARSQRFAAARGFDKTGRAHRISRLMLSEVNLDGYDGIEENLARENIVVEPMSELDADDEAFLRELHAAVEDAAQDIPSTEDYKPTPFEIWRENFLKSPDSRAEAYFAALHDGHPIGIANLIIPGEGRAVNGLTAVMRASRGRGVARVLKLRTVRWAQENGIEFIDTGNDAENARMLAINVRIGYKPLPAREEWLKEYPPGS